MKKILGIYNTPQRHWVGDGFPVQTVFSYGSHSQQISPFLMLDYAAPMPFPPTPHSRGVEQHPHRGFETVSIVYQGELAHRDSTGKSGVIGAGDVQWMTAGSGILHEEFHSPTFSQEGGVLEVAQLWVNLPAKDKMTPPSYQAIVSKDIPVVALPNDAGSVRVIAGEFNGHVGPAHTFTPMNVWDIRLSQGGLSTLMLPDGWNTILVMLRGSVTVNGSENVNEQQVVMLDTIGQTVSLEAKSEAIILLLNGQPIDEPVVGHGPFVMNNQQEIRQAIDDFRNGRFGKMPS